MFFPRQTTLETILLPIQIVWAILLKILSHCACGAFFYSILLKWGVWVAIKKQFHGSHAVNQIWRIWTEDAYELKKKQYKLWQAEKPAKSCRCIIQNPKISAECLSPCSSQNICHLLDHLYSIKQMISGSHILRKNMVQYNIISSTISSSTSCTVSRNLIVHAAPFYMRIMLFKNRGTTVTSQL